MAVAFDNSSQGITNKSALGAASEICHGVRRYFDMLTKYCPAAITTELFMNHVFFLKTVASGKYMNLMYLLMSLHMSVLVSHWCFFWCSDVSFGEQKLSSFRWPGSWTVSSSKSLWLSLYVWLYTVIYVMYICRHVVISGENSFSECLAPN